MLEDRVAALSKLGSMLHVVVHCDLNTNATEGGAGVDGGANATEGGAVNVTGCAPANATEGAAAAGADGGANATEGGVVNVTGRAAANADVATAFGRLPMERRVSKTRATFSSNMFMRCTTASQSWCVFALLVLLGQH